VDPELSDLLAGLITDLEKPPEPDETPERQPADARAPDDSPTPA
jgi:hypothetical protein